MFFFLPQLKNIKSRHSVWHEEVLLKNFYLCLAVLGLRCSAQAFSSFGEQVYSLFVVHGLLILVASLVAENGSRACRLSNCGAQA